MFSQFTAIFYYSNKSFQHGICYLLLKITTMQELSENVGEKENKAPFGTLSAKAKPTFF